MQLRNFRFSLFFAVTAALLSILLGSSIALGWILRYTPLVQWFPEYMGIMYNTALCFIASGIALLATLAGRKKLVVILVSFVIVLSGLSLAQDLFHFDIGIDHLLIEAYASFNNPIPGHMPPNAAAEMLMISLALLLNNLRANKFLLVLSNYLNLIITSMGGIAIFGYMTHITTAYGWGDYTHMAPAGAVGFTTMGLGLFALARETSKKYGIDMSYGMPTFSMVSVIIFTLLLYQSLIINPYIAVHLSNSILAAGVLFAILLGRAINLAQTARHSLSLTKATFESTADGIVVVDNRRLISDYNQNFLKLWQIVPPVIHPKQTREISEWILQQLTDPEKYRLVLKELYRSLTSEIDEEISLKNGKTFFYHSQPQKIGERIVGRVFTFRDISERKQMEEQLLHQATHDLLTGLPNRALLMDRLEQAIINAKRTQQQIAVLFFDLDRFKVVNDTLGHQKGDQLIQTAAARLKSCIFDRDTVARIGGDEFIVILINIKTPETVINVSQKCLNSLAQPFIIDNHQFNLTTSLGISLFPTDGQDANTLLKNADMAMYRAKEAGRNNFQYYTKEMFAASQEQLELENELRQALAREEFLLYYQPQIEIKTKRIVGFEVLLRWQHPMRGLLSPLTFITLAEERNLILPIGEWILHTACAQNKTWQSMGLPPVKIAVNLASQQFKDSKIATKVAEILEETKLPARYLELELTESHIMENTQLFVATMHEFKKIGIHLAIDDFGIGYSNLSYLKQFPIDKIKIDQAFTKNIPEDTNNSAIVLAIIALAKSLKLRVVAEGVETEPQLNFLAENNCDDIQGYYFSKPLPVKEATLFLQKFSNNSV